MCDRIIIIIDNTLLAHHRQQQQSTYLFLPEAALAPESRPPHNQLQKHCIAGTMLSDSDKNIVVNTLRNSAVTQESIQSASRTLAKYYNCANEVVQLWQEEIYEADEAKILPLMYIANDIIQTTKRTGSNYVDAFLDCMKACFCAFVRQSTQKLSVN